MLKLSRTRVQSIMCFLVVIFAALNCIQDFSAYTKEFDALGHYSRNERNLDIMHQEQGKDQPAATNSSALIMKGGEGAPDTSIIILSSLIPTHPFPTPLNSRVVAPGFAACLLVLDDMIRLHEWVAYHYTVLPLSSLVIGLDPKTSNDSIAEIQSMAQSWKDVGLNITIWPTNPKRYEVKMSRQENKMPEYQRMQTHFVTSCTHHFIDRAKENWLLLADSDEFLSYNLIKQGEEEESPNSIFQGPTAPSKEKIASDREQALPIREQLLDYIHQNTTILSLIQEQKDNSSQTYFPSISGCTRVVGLAFGTNVTNGNKGEILMTRKYQTHQKALHNRFSKVILELPKIRSRHLTHYETIHNPFPKLCGKNGRFSSGQDFKSSVLRVSHYIGSLESWVERGGGKEFRRAQNVETWEKKNADGGPYEEDQLDTSMGYWFDTFLSKVGNDAGEKLLLKPLRNRIDYVRSKQNMSYVS